MVLICGLFIGAVRTLNLPRRSLSVPAESSLALICRRNGFMAAPPEIMKTITARDLTGLRA
jgi:hypothetical protein